eukprot:g1836.t1
MTTITTSRAHKYTLMTTSVAVLVVLVAIFLSKGGEGSPRKHDNEIEGLEDIDVGVTFRGYHTMVNQFIIPFDTNKDDGETMASVYVSVQIGEGSNAIQKTLIEPGAMLPATRFVVLSQQDLSIGEDQTVPFFVTSSTEKTGDTSAFTAHGCHFHFSDDDEDSEMLKFQAKVSRHGSVQLFSESSTSCVYSGPSPLPVRFVVEEMGGNEIANEDRSQTMTVDDAKDEEREDDKDACVDYVRELEEAVRRADTEKASSESCQNNLRTCNAEIASSNSACANRTRKLYDARQATQAMLTRCKDFTRILLERCGGADEEKLYGLGGFSGWGENDEDVDEEAMATIMNDEDRTCASSVVSQADVAALKRELKDCASSSLQLKASCEQDRAIAREQIEVAMQKMASNTETIEACESNLEAATERAHAVEVAIDEVRDKLHRSELDSSQLSSELRALAEDHESRAATCESNLAVLKDSLERDDNDRLVRLGEELNECKDDRARLVASHKSAVVQESEKCRALRLTCKEAEKSLVSLAAEKSTVETKLTSIEAKLQECETTQTSNEVDLRECETTLATAKEDTKARPDGSLECQVEKAEIERIHQALVGMESALGSCEEKNAASEEARSRAVSENESKRSEIERGHRALSDVKRDLGVCEENLTGSSASLEQCERALADTPAIGDVGQTNVVALQNEIAALKRVLFVAGAVMVATGGMLAAKKALD